MPYHLSVTLYGYVEQGEGEIDLQATIFGDGQRQRVPRIALAVLGLHVAAAVAVLALVYWLEHA